MGRRMKTDEPRRPRNEAFWRRKTQLARDEQHRMLELVRKDKRNMRMMVEQGFPMLAQQYRESARGWLQLASSWAGLKRLRLKVAREAALNDAADAAGIRIPEIT